MDWFAIAAVAFAAFIAGLQLVSRVIAWVAGLALILKSRDAGRGEQAGLSLAQLFLHSGPWSLALAIAALYYVASLSQSTWLWAVLGGLGAAIAVLLTTVAVARWRQRRGIAPLVPLTPERLLKIRRRFMWGTTIYFGGSVATANLYLMWAQLGQSVSLVLFIVVVCLGGGYLFSWFMWQFYGAALQARETARQRAGRNNAV